MCYNDGKSSMCALNVIFSNGLLTRRVKLRARMGLSWSSYRKQSVKWISGVLAFFFNIFIHSLSNVRAVGPFGQPSFGNQTRSKSNRSTWDKFSERTVSTVRNYGRLGFKGEDLSDFGYVHIRWLANSLCFTYYHLTIFLTRSPLRHSTVTDIPKNGWERLVLCFLFPWPTIFFTHLSW